MKGFGVKNQQTFFKDEISSRSVDDSHLEFDRRRKPPKRPFGLRSCSEGNHKRNHHKEVVRVGCEITNRCEGFGNTVAMLNPTQHLRMGKV
jgi:hypothetical protein